jgi:hypothetical protein
MFLEGRTPALRAGASVETTSFPENCDLQVTIGLDTAGEHRLLDQRISFETKTRRVDNPPYYSPNNPFCAATATAAARESTLNFW